MGKQIKYYIENDVYVEAKNRINHIIDTFDNIIVSFSGGKDSLVVLSLVEEVYKERGIKEKIKVKFHDEEVIPNSVVDFVREKAESGKYDFRYYAVPMKSEKYILGKTYEYIQWDTNRRHLRTPPDYAIRLPEGDKRVFSQYIMDDFTSQSEKGKVAILLGIRAEESLTRLRSCLNKKNENYINDTENPRIKKCKPIYDWTEKDVFIYFFRSKVKYCPWYDAQMLNSQALRVATPLIANSAKNLHKFRTIDPVFFQQIMDVFPEMKVQEKYYRSLAKDNAFDGYEHSIDGVIQFAEDTQPEADVKVVVQMLRSAWTIRNNNLSKGLRRYVLGGYPILYLFKEVKRSGFSHKKMILPANRITNADFEFENLNPNDYK